ncbi:MAG TPA: hypothetical protein VML75_21170 [Kofleriaceae bacterium]|nr:hypothetical protein [Kofleriaceae bacterium]
MQRLLVVWCVLSCAACGSDKGTTEAVGAPAPSEVPVAPTPVAAEPAPVVAEPPTPAPPIDAPEAETAAREAAARAASKHRLETVYKEEEAAKAIAVLLAGADDGVFAELRDGRQGGDLDRQINEVRQGGAGATVGGRVDGDAPPGTVKIARTARVTIPPAVVSDPSLVKPMDVTSKMRATYAASLRRCYLERLKVDPDYTATVWLSFTIQARGRTANARAAVDPPAADLAACVRGVAGSWIFPIPRDADGEPGEVDVAIELTLSPR